MKNIHCYYDGKLYNDLSVVQIGVFEPKLFQFYQNQTDKNVTAYAISLVQIHQLEPNQMHYLRWDHAWEL